MEDGHGGDRCRGSSLYHLSVKYGMMEAAAHPRRDAHEDGHGLGCGHGFGHGLRGQRFVTTLT